MLRKSQREGTPTPQLPFLPCAVAGSSSTQSTVPKQVEQLKTGTPSMSVSSCAQSSPQAFQNRASSIAPNL